MTTLPLLPNSKANCKRVAARYALLPLVCTDTPGNFIQSALRRLFPRTSRKPGSTPGWMTADRKAVLVLVVPFFVCVKVEASERCSHLSEASTFPQATRLGQNHTQPRETIMTSTTVIIIILGAVILFSMISAARTIWYAVSGQAEIDRRMMM